MEHKTVKNFVLILILVNRLIAYILPSSPLFPLGFTPSPFQTQLSLTPVNLRSPSFGINFTFACLLNPDIFVVPLLATKFVRSSLHTGDGHARMLFREKVISIW